MHCTFKGSSSLLPSKLITTFSSSVKIVQKVTQVTAGADFKVLLLLSLACTHAGQISRIYL